MPIFIMREVFISIGPPSRRFWHNGGFCLKFGGFKRLSTPLERGEGRVGEALGEENRLREGREFVLWRMRDFRSKVRSFGGRWVREGSVLVLWLRREHCADWPKRRLGSVRY
ncbi:MAG: hypothetical protein ACTS6P_01800 [Candidatus Hodgkinia cicadicola]